MSPKRKQDLRTKNGVERFYPLQNSWNVERTALPSIYNGTQGWEEPAVQISDRYSRWNIVDGKTPMVGEFFIKLPSCLFHRNSPSQYLHRVLRHAAPNVCAQLQLEVVYFVHFVENSKLYPVR